MTTQTFSVTGMTCDHCVGAVTQEIRSLAGVEEDSVDLAPGEASTVTVRSTTGLDVADVRAAVDEAGYDLVE